MTNIWKHTVQELLKETFVFSGDFIDETVDPDISEVEVVGGCNIKQAQVTCTADSQEISVPKCVFPEDSRPFMGTHNEASLTFLFFFNIFF